MSWKNGLPEEGSIFFFEPGEIRTTSGDGFRVVRVGTHALTKKSKTTLWKRLRQHRGTLSGKYAGGGNHRGSFFRLRVGMAFIKMNRWKDEGTGSWGDGSSAPSHVREDECWIEKTVSDHIRRILFLWLAVNDPPGSESQRAFIEKNANALLSNYPYVGITKETAHCIDPQSKE